MGYPKNFSSILCFLLCLVVCLVCVQSAPQFGGWPDMNRRLPARMEPPGCAYKGQKYEHGEQIETPEPCLNCTCIRGLLVCYLRVCPTAVAPKPGCFPAREVGQCCPTIICGVNDLVPQPDKVNSEGDTEDSPQNETSQEEEIPELRPTFRPSSKEPDSTTDSSTVSGEKQTLTALSTNFEIPSTTEKETDYSDSSSSPESITYAAQVTSLFTHKVKETTVDSEGKLTSGASLPSTSTETADENTFADSTETTDSDEETSKEFSTFSETTRWTSTSVRDTEVPHTTLADSYSYDDTSATSEVTKGSDQTSSSMTGTTGVFQTSGMGGSTSAGDSLVFVTSSTLPTTMDSTDYDINFLNDIPGGCFVNGTLYGDGSAMLSASFCEYCFCIRGKQTCLKPKCHLVIEGCLAKYDSEFTCCPTRYDCSSSNSSKEVLSSEYETTTTREDTTTTTLSSLPTEIEGICIVGEEIYLAGEAVPSVVTCTTCYCSSSGVVCNKISCSPPVDGCKPHIPEGHCCPTEYRCDNQAPFQDGGIEEDYENDLHPHSTRSALPTTTTDGEKEISSTSGELPLSHWFSSDDKSKSTTTLDSTLVQHVVEESETDGVFSSTFGTTQHPKILQNLVPSERRINSVTGIDEYLRALSVNHDNTKSSKDPNPVYIPKSTTRQEITSRTFTTTHSQSDTTNDHPYDNSFKIENTNHSDNENRSDVLISITNSDFNHTTVALPAKEESPSGELATYSASKSNESTEASFYSASKSDASTEASSYSASKSDASTEASSYSASKSDASTEASSYLNLSDPVNFTDSEKYSTEKTFVPDHVFKEASSDVTHSTEEDILYTTGFFKRSGIIEEMLNTGSESGNSANTLATTIKTPEVKLSSGETSSTYSNRYESFTRPVSKSHVDEIKDFPSTAVHPVPSLIHNEGNTESTSNLQHSAKDTDFTTNERIPRVTSVKEESTESSTESLIKESPHFEIAENLGSFSLAADISPSTEEGNSSKSDSTNNDQSSTLEDHTITPDLIYEKGHTFLSSTLSSYDSSDNISRITSDIPIIYKNEIHLPDTDTTGGETVTSSSTDSGNSSADPHKKYEVPSLAASSTPISTLDFEDIAIRDEKAENLPQSRSTKNPTVTLQELTNTPQPLLENNSSSDKHDDNYSFNDANLKTTSHLFMTSEPQPLATVIHPVLLKSDYVGDISRQGVLKSRKDRFEDSAGSELKKHTSSLTEVQSTVPNGPSNLTDKFQHITSDASTFTTEDSSQSRVPSVTRENDSNYDYYYYSDDHSEEQLSAEGRHDFDDVPVSKNPGRNKKVPQSFRTAEPKVTTDSGTTLIGEGTTHDKSTVGMIHIGMPLTVEGHGGNSKKQTIFNDIYVVNGGNGRTTLSGGVIYMDPKYTDIKPDNSHHFNTEPRFPKTTEITTLSYLNPFYSTSSQPSPIDRADHDDLQADKKKPRIEDPRTGSSSDKEDNANVKIIPFVAEDAVMKFGKNRNQTILAQQLSTQASPEIVSDFCFVNGRIYINGEMITKPDPCELCRCFYGRELCQLQRCPTPPSTYCTPEQLPGFCCPRYTCNGQRPGDENQPPTEIISAPGKPPLSGTSLISNIPSLEDEPERHGIAIDYSDDLDTITTLQPNSEELIKPASTGYSSHKEENVKHTIHASTARPSTYEDINLDIFTELMDSNLKFGNRVRPPTSLLMTARPGFRPGTVNIPRHPTTLSSTTTTSRPVTITSARLTTTTTPKTTTTTSKPTTTYKTTKVLTTATSPSSVSPPSTTTKTQAVTEPPKTSTAAEVPLFDPWGLLKVSGCNIYGRFYKVNERVEILSGPCNHCICASNGVECNDIC